MRNLKSIKGKKVFFLGLSRRWSSVERALLRDCLEVQRQDATAYLYTFKKSLVSEKARENGVKVFYHDGEVYTKVFRWHHLKKMVQKILDLKPDIVHVYDIKMLWPMCFFLRASKHISLVYSQNYFLPRYYKSFYHQALISRVDQVFVNEETMTEHTVHHLKIPKKKVEVLGTASVKARGDCSKPSFKYTDSRYYLGTNISGIETNTGFMETCFYALQVMIERKSLDKEITFVLGNEKSWGDSILTGKLKRLVKDWGLEEHVAFVDRVPLEELQYHLDLWVGLIRREGIEDFSVQANLNGTPCVIPRTEASIEYLHRFGQIGETYMAQDSRDLRVKCERVINNLSTYKRNLDHAFEEIQEGFGESAYKEGLISSYSRLIKRRERLFGKKS